jgi:hypothetical protein
MTSRDNEDDWMDDFLDDKSSMYQMMRFEQLMITSSANMNYQHINIEQITYGEAQDIIKDLEENDNPRDCREQFYKIFKRS